MTLTPREIAKLLAFVDNHTMHVINLMKHPDVTDDGRAQYQKDLAENERIRQELEREALLQ